MPDFKKEKKNKTSEKQNKKTHWPVRPAQQAGGWKVGQR